MAKAEKVAAVADLVGEFESSNGAVLADYRGLSVAQLRALRRALGDTARFAVVKNTLTKRAALESGVADQLGYLLEGPSAIAFVKGDVVETAKGLRDFAKTNPQLVVKGGVVDGSAVSAADISKLADLESRAALLAKVAGTLKASLSNAAATFDALPAKTAQLSEALRVKRAQADEEKERPAEDTGETAGSGEAAETGETAG